MDKEKLLESLCDKYSYIIRLLRIMGVDENDVEDLAVDVFMAAFNSIGSLRDPEKLMPWLKTIATNKAAGYFKSRNKQREIANMMKTEAGEMDFFDIAATESTVEGILQKAEENAMVETLLDSLSDAGRRIIRMRFWGDYKFKEIADIMHLNVNTVKSVYRRSLKKLETNYYDILRKKESHGGAR